MVNRVKSSLRNRIYFTIRKKLKEKIIVIESDDWGMERAPDQKAVEYAIKRFGREKISRWTMDSLETPEDLSRLYELINSFKHKFEYPPVITTNFITHNIITESDNTFSFLPIDQGFISQNQKSLKNLYSEGIEQGFILPQLHGFVHYHLSDLENYLRSERSIEFKAQGFPLMEATIKGNLHFLRGEIVMRNTEIKSMIQQATAVFENMFGFNSTSFIAPNYLFDLPLIEILVKQGISYLQGASNYFNDKGNRLYYPALRRREGMVWGIRNARLDVHPDYSFFHEQCLNSINKAFNQDQPAIIDIHRVNFSGTITPELRDKTLVELDALFRFILKKWPNVRFMSSNQLNKYIYGT